MLALSYGVANAPACPMCKDGLVMAGTKQAAMARQKKRANAYSLSVLVMLAIPFAGVSALAVLLVKVWGREEDWAVSPPRPGPLVGKL